MKIQNLALLLLSERAFADDSLFVGTMVSSKTLDSIADYKNDNGAQVTAEGIVSETDKIEVGLRTPNVKGFRANGTINSDLGHTAFAEKKLGDNKLRAGFAGNNETSGILAGGKIGLQNLTLDGDLGIINDRFEARGFLAVMPGNVYLSAGGNIFEHSVTSTQGLIRDGFGVYNVVKADLDDNVYAGKLMIGDKFAMNRGQFDFRNQLKTGTELENITNGAILAGWAPFDAYCSERFSFAGNWNLSEEGKLIIGELGYNVDRKFVVTSGVSYEGDYGIRLGLLSKVPETQIEVWLSGDYDIKTNSIATTAYVGGAWSW